MSNRCARRTVLPSLPFTVQNIKTFRCKILLITDLTEFDQTANPISLWYFISAFQPHQWNKAIEQRSSAAGGQGTKPWGGFESSTTASLHPGSPALAAPRAAPATQNSGPGQKFGAWALAMRAAELPGELQPPWRKAGPSRPLAHAGMLRHRICAVGHAPTPEKQLSGATDTYLGTQGSDNSGVPQRLYKPLITLRLKAWANFFLIFFCSLTIQVKFLALFLGKKKISYSHYGHFWNLTS